jgi:hypothetical protein
MTQHELDALYTAAQHPDVVRGVFARLFGALEGELSGDNAASAKWAMEHIQHALDRENGQSGKVVIQKRIPGVPKEFWQFAIWHDDPEGPSDYTREAALQRIRRLKDLLPRNSSVEYRVVRRTEDVVLDMQTKGGEDDM